MRTLNISQDYYLNLLSFFGEIQKMLHSTAFDTTVGKSFDLRLIEKQIHEAIIRDNIFNQTLDIDNNVGDYKSIFLYGLYTSENNIPFFSHSILMEHGNIKFLVTDIRPFVKKSSSMDDIDVKNITEFNIAKSRHVLTLAWLNHEILSIKNELDFSAICFSSWISEVIAKKYALDPKDQLVLNIMCNYYYNTLFSNESHLENIDLERIAVKTIKATKATSQLVFETFDKINGIGNINDFCDKVPDVLENIRLKDFNLAILLTVIANSWYGLNSKEILTVALEHPPTWCSIVYGSLTERTYRNSLIAKISERYGKFGNSDNFLKAYSSIVRQYVTAKTISREDENEIVLLPFED